MEKDRRIIEKIGGRREDEERTKKKGKRREEGEYRRVNKEGERWRRM